jgi:hypothetical protein
MHYRYPFRFLSKDNDKIIGRMLKRTYWTPDYDTKESAIKIIPTMQNVKSENKFLLNIAVRLDMIEKKMDDLIILNKTLDSKVNKMIKNLNRKCD